MYYNDLLDRQNSGWDSDKVTYFYVGDIFGLYLDSMYADFKEKNLCIDFWEKVPNFSL